MKLKNKVRGLVQIATVLFLIKPFLKIRYDFRICNLENTKNLKGPLLIITNHKHIIDSFVFGAAISQSSKLFPIRFMGEVDHFYFPVLEFLRKIRIVGFFYKIFGVVPAIRGKGLNVALQKPAEIIKKGGVFLIHPEDHVTKGDEIAQFKRGAPALALKTGAPILPVAFKLDKHYRPVKYSIKFGEVFKMPEGVDETAGAEYMRDIVAKLYNSIG